MDEERVFKSIKSYNSAQFGLKKKPIAEFDDCFVASSKYQDDVVSFVSYKIGEMMSLEIMLDVSKSYLDDPEAVNMFRKFLSSLMENPKLEESDHKLREFDEDFKKRFCVFGYVLDLFDGEYAELYVDSDDEDEEDFEEDDAGLHFLAPFTFSFFDEKGFKFAQKCLDENGQLYDNTALYEVGKSYIE